MPDLWGTHSWHLVVEFRLNKDRGDSASALEPLNSQLSGDAKRAKAAPGRRAPKEPHSKRDVLLIWSAAVRLVRRRFGLTFRRGLLGAKSLTLGARLSTSWRKVSPQDSFLPSAKNWD
jgi:hypothetical protein